MNVLITGATTPLGEALIDRLLAHQATGTILAVGREPEVRWTDRRVSYLAIDLRRPRAVHDLLEGPAQDLAIEAVVHAAHHRDPHDIGRRVHAQNVESTRALVLGCAAHATIRRFVYRSFAEVYAQPHATTSLVDEDAPLDFDPSTPQWTRDRVEADLVVCAQRSERLRVVVLRCAEILAPQSGSQLWDYLASRVCLRPAGFDPMINVLSVDDAVVALVAALHAPVDGVFNIRGADTLPLSSAIVESHRADLPIPGSWMSTLYKLRRAVTGFDFRYDLNAQRFHFGGILDGTRASALLGYTPRHHVHWPVPRWRLLLERLALERVR